MTASFIPVYVAFIVVFLILVKQRKAETIRKIIKNRKKRGISYMSDVFNRYIGKDCVVYVSNGNYSAIECNVISVNDNWLLVKSKDGEEVINFDYIIRIKEHPVNKKGKKKTVFT